MRLWTSVRFLIKASRRLLDAKLLENPPPLTPQMVNVTNPSFCALSLLLERPVLAQRRWAFLSSLRDRWTRWKMDLPPPPLRSSC